MASSFWYPAVHDGDTDQLVGNNLSIFLELELAHSIRPPGFWPRHTTSSTFFGQRRLRVTTNQTRALYSIYELSGHRSARGHFERLAARSRYCNSAPEVDVRPRAACAAFFIVARTSRTGPGISWFSSPPITIKKRTPLLRNGTGAVVVITRAPSDAVGNQRVGTDDDGITALYAVASDSESPSGTPFQIFNRDESKFRNSAPIIHKPTTSFISHFLCCGKQLALVADDERHVRSSVQAGQARVFTRCLRASTRILHKNPSFHLRYNPEVLDLHSKEIMGPLTPSALRSRAMIPHWHRGAFEGQEYFKFQRVLLSHFFTWLSSSTSTTARNDSGTNEYRGRQYFHYKSAPLRADIQAFAVAAVRSIDAAVSVTGRHGLWPDHLVVAIDSATRS
ncbi:hypothetical protein BJY52DRAFT_1364145 [Lactarius psammicola]|nr:hypothetical protein BJY52DRAFT_1364145 [Lactarius psammicola]